MHAFILLFVLVLSGGLAEAAEPQLPRLRVFTSVLPVKHFVERVGGSSVEVEVMVPPGQSPATYDPSPKQVAALASADLYVRVGVPFEDAWMKRIQAANPDMPVLDLRDGLQLRTQEAHTHDGGAHVHALSGQSEMDPHVWTSPLNARQMLISIRDQLSLLDREGATAYAQRQAAYDAELLELHQWLKTRLSELNQPVFLVYHPAWGYFADLYGLAQVPIEQAGKEPGPRRLAALIDQARAVGAHAIFIQPEFDQRIAEQLARSIEGRVEVATPLAEDYAENLKRFATILIEAELRPDVKAEAGANQRAPTR